MHKTQPLCTYFLLNCTKIRQGSSSYLRQHLQKLWLAESKNQQSYMVQRQWVTDCLNEKSEGFFSNLKVPIFFIDVVRWYPSFTILNVLDYLILWGSLGSRSCQQVYNV